MDPYVARYIHLTPDKCSQAFPIPFHFRVLYAEHKPKNKKWGRPGNEKISVLSQVHSMSNNNDGNKLMISLVYFATTAITVLANKLLYHQM